MHNKLKRRALGTLTVIVVLAVALASCKTKKAAVDTKDLSYLYNPTRSSFNPGINVTVQSEESATLAVRFFSNDLFFSEANPEGVPTAGIIISMKLYNIDQARSLVDTVSYNLNIIRDANRREYFYNFPLKVESGMKYLIELKILDKLRLIVTQNFVPFPFSLSTNISALLSSQYLLTIAKPNPFPSNCLVYPCCSCENGVNNCPKYSCDIPIPVSLTSTKMLLLKFLDTITSTLPFAVNLMAFSIILLKIC